MKSQGKTQVTINVVDHKETSLKQVFTEVKKWAKEYEVKVTGSELVGMIPQQVVFEGMFDYLSLNQPPRVLPPIK